MRLNDDVSLRAVMHGAKMEWVKSPMPGVERRMLFRIGEEKARATSLVRYAPGSHFSSHDHPGGEEILVLDGVFQDESGDYPAGSYIRNPPGSRHTPASATGCLLFVKLWQFRKDDTAHVAIRPDQEIPGASWPGVASSQKLFDNGHEEVRLERWQPNAAIAIANPDGLELLVLEGGFAMGLAEFRRLSWLRLPPGEHFKADTGPDAARVFVKTGKLLQDDLCEF